MSRAPLSVVVTASGNTGQFRACLDSLRPGLGVRDEVVVVLPGERSDLRPELRGESWLTVLDDDSGDQAARWTAGIGMTSHPIVVLLDGEVILPARWLDPLADAFSEPDVVGAGPRCRLSFGPQYAEVPAEALRTPATFRTYARQWAEERKGRYTEVDRLGPVCVALRRDALDRVGGPAAEAPVTDLPYGRLREHGRLLLAEAVLVAHANTGRCSLYGRSVESGTLVSGCLIVKDEQDVLAGCLAALHDFVDEIVVYDTGSSDRTVEIAREHGARVVEGYWDEHFGDARNRALAHCAGEWVLQVDADEVVTGVPAAARAYLRDTDELALSVAIESQEGHEGTSASMVSRYPRLFRRHRARYFGRLHEQVLDRVTGHGLARTEMPHLSLLHSGYTVVRRTAKDKYARNLRLAELDAADRTTDASALLNLARSQFVAHEHSVAIETCRRVLASSPGHRDRLLALKLLIDGYVRAGRLADAYEALEELRRHAKESITGDYAEAGIRFAARDFAGTVELAALIPESAVDELLFDIGRRGLAEIEIKSLFFLDRRHEAAELLRKYLRAGHVPLTVHEMADALEGDGSELEEVVDLLPAHSARGLLFAANQAPYDLADRLLEKLWHRTPGDPVVSAFVARIGQRVPLVRALEWSVRLREHGFAEYCTLIGSARDRRRTPRDRVLAAAIALEMFADERALPLLADALDNVSDADSMSVLAELREVAPGVAQCVEPVGADRT